MWAAVAFLAIPTVAQATESMQMNVQAAKSTDNDQLNCQSCHANVFATQAPLSVEPVADKLDALATYHLDTTSRSYVGGGSGSGNSWETISPLSAAKLEPG